MMKFVTETDTRFFRPLIVIGTGVVLVVLALVLDRIATAPPPLEQHNVDAKSATAMDPPTVAPLSAAPAFDVVRVEPSGDAVVAGRGAPGARISVRSGETLIGEAVADERGEWLVAPAQPLPPGTHQLTVEARGDDGRQATGDDVIVVIVPPLAADAPAPLTVKTSRTAAQPSTVLQSASGARADGNGIETVDLTQDGRLAISGRAAPHGFVRIYLDNALIGETAADGLGLWRLMLERPVAAGDHALRADQVSERGDVLARAKVPLRVAGGGATLGAASGAVVVERGNSLWSIARDVYGEGHAFTVIYDANRQQIDNPDLIYPGQVFDIPKAK